MQSMSSPSGTARRAWLAHHGNCPQLEPPDTQRQSAPSRVTAHPAEQEPLRAQTSMQDSPADHMPLVQRSSTGSRTPEGSRPQAGASVLHGSPGAGKPSDGRGTIVA